MKTTFKPDTPEQAKKRLEDALNQENLSKLAKEAIDKKIKEANIALSSTEKQIKERQALLSDINSSVEVLNAKRLEATNELNKTLITQANTVKEEKEAFAILESEKAKLKEDMNTIKASIKAEDGIRKDNISKSQEVLKIIQKDLITIQAEYAGVKAEISRAEEKLALILSDIKKKEAKASELDDEITEKNTQIKQLKTQIIKSEDELDRNKDTIAKLTTEVALLYTQKQESDATIEKQKEEIQKQKEESLSIIVREQKVKELEKKIISLYSKAGIAITL